MDILYLPNAASPTWTLQILSRNALMLALGSVLTRDSGYTGVERHRLIQSSSDLMKINSMHNHAILQGTTHSDALHRSSMHKNSMQGDPVCSDSDAAHANSASY